MPSLQITTISGSNISANKAYVLYALGGFRRQTAVVVKNGNTHEWNKDEMFPVSSASKPELEIVVYEPSKFGDKHCGSVKVLWPDLSNPYGERHEHTLSLGGINANKASLTLAFVLDSPVSLPTQNMNRSAVLNASMRTNQPQSENKEPEKPGINPALAALVKSNAPPGPAFRPMTPRQVEEAKIPVAEPKPSAPKKSPSSNFEESLKMQAVAPIDLRDDPTKKAVVPILANRGPTEKHSDFQPPTRLAPLAPVVSSEPPPVVEETPPPQPIKKKKPKKNIVDEHIEEEVKPVQQSVEKNVEHINQKQKPHEETSSKKAKDSDSDDEIGIKGVVGGKKIGPEPTRATTPLNKNLTQEVSHPDEAHLGRAPNLKLKDDHHQIKQNQAHDFSVNSSTNARPSSSNVIKSERPPSAKQPPKQHEPDILELPGIDEENESKSSIGESFLANSRPTTPAVRPITQAPQAARPTTPAQNQIRPSSAKPSAEVIDSLPTSQPSQSFVERPLSGRTTGSFLNSIPSFPESEGPGLVDVKFLNKGSNNSSIPEEESQTSHGNSGAPLSVKNSSLVNINNPNLIRPSLSPIPQPNLLGMTKPPAPVLDPGPRDILDELASSTDLGSTKKKGRTPKADTQPKVLGVLGSGVPMVNLAAKKQAPVAESQPSWLEEDEPLEPPKLETQERPASASSHRSSRSLGKEALALVMGSSDQVREFLENAKLGRFAEKIITSGTDSMEALQKLDVDYLTEVGMRTNHIQTLQKALSSYSRNTSSPDTMEIRPGSAMGRPQSAKAMAERPPSARGTPLDRPISAKAQALERPTSAKSLLAERPTSAKSTIVDRGNSVQTLPDESLLTDTYRPDSSFHLLGTGVINSIWQYMDDSGDWCEYDAVTTRKLAAAKAAGQREISVQMFENSYVVDLVNLFSSDLITGFSFPIRELASLDDAEPASWYWMDDDCEWVEYEPSVARILSQARYAGTSSVTVQSNGENYMINLRTLEQLDSEGISRPIRDRPLTASRRRETNTHSAIWGPNYSVSTDSLWDWMDNDGRWQPYSDDINELLSQAKSDGEITTNIEVDNVNYVVDLLTMVQFDSEGMSRPIRQRPKMGAFNPSESIMPQQAECPWYWMDDTGEWVEYDVSISNYLSEILQKGENAAFFELGKAVFKVDPWAMEQVNLANNFSCPITREPIPLDWGDTPIFGSRLAYGATEAEAALAVQFNPANPQAALIDPADIKPDPNGKGLIYSGELFPYPLEPVTDTRPDEHYEKIHQKRLEELKQKEEQHNAERQNNPPPPPESHGFKGALQRIATNVKSSLSDATHSISQNTEMAGIIAERKARQLQLEKLEKDYKKVFTGINDKLVAVYSCSYAVGDEPHKGQLFLTEGHVLFLGGNLKNLRFGIPLAEIVSIQKAVAMGTAAIQIFTMQRGFYQMADFTDVIGDVLKQLRQTVQGTAFDRAYNYLDHLWRDRAEVPNPNVKYLPPCTLFVH